MNAKPIPCPHCSRMFAENGGVYQHIKAKHGGKGKGAFRQPRDDSDRSIASLMVEAQVDRACGLPVDAWLAEILP